MARLARRWNCWLGGGTKSMIQRLPFVVSSYFYDGQSLLVFIIRDRPAFIFVDARLALSCMQTESPHFWQCPLLISYMTRLFFSIYVVSPYNEDCLPTSIPPGPFENLPEGLLCPTHNDFQELYFMSFSDIPGAAALSKQTNEVPKRWLMIRLIVPE
jgi:hypothetical protein